jgi:putative heme transporter
VGISVGIIVIIFARVIPMVVGVEYHEVIGHLRAVDRWTLVGLAVVWGLSLWSYGGVLAASLPGLSRSQGVVVNISGSALANVVPFGGAAGVAATYAQCLSWGHRVSSITLSIIVTGTWNVLVKLGLPILVLAGLAVTHQPSEGLGRVGIAGFVLVVGAVAGLVVTFRHRELAADVGAGAQRVVNLARRALRRAPIEDLPARVVSFRDQASDLISARWWPLTAWMVAVKASQALLLVLCARAVGIEGIGWLHLLAVYAFGELLTTIAVTPSGLGFVEGGSAQLLVAFGAPPAEAMAAVVLYRLFTYVAEVPLGAAGWFTWATRHSWRR